MAETVLYALLEWSIRTAVLAGVVGALLAAARIKNAHTKLSAWTIVLAASLLIPFAAPLTPRVSISVPRFFAQATKPKPEPQPAFQLPPLRRDSIATPRNTPLHWSDLCAGLWLLIALTMLLRLWLGSRLSARLVRASKMIDGNLRESDLVRVPITVGVIRPRIILPSDWRDWPEHKLRAVVAHEQAHVERRDPARQLAASIYRSLAWFHPLAWWLRAELVELAEQASDDAAIAAAEDRVGYAEALLSFIERTPQRVEWEGVTMANRQTRMRRIVRVLDNNRELSAPSTKRALAVLIVAALPLIYLATAMRPVLAQAPAAVPSGHAQLSNTNVCGGNAAYAKWLNEDVAYLITNEERRAFEQLPSAAECSMFVEQFWLRRDPTPGTPENEFKEEYYRRIAYANQHFATAVPGWRTDRGRVYITYGPPDEIEAHPGSIHQRPAEEGGGTSELYPFDQWLYHHNNALGIDILFEFVDRTRDNDYRLTFMGGPEDREALQGRGEEHHTVFGQEGGLYIEVKPNRTIFITTPVRGSSVPVHGRIVDQNGTTVETFEDVNHSAIYGKWIVHQLPAGQYVLHLEVDNDRHALIFQVK